MESDGNGARMILLLVSDCHLKVNTVQLVFECM